MIVAKVKGEWREFEPKILPYFFVEEDGWDKIREKTSPLGVEKGYLSIDSRPTVKLEYALPSEVKAARDLAIAKGVKTYEADVRFAQTRWIIDTGQEIEDSPRVAFFDVEADSRGGFPTPKAPSARILSVAAVSHTGKEFFISETDEVEIFRKFQKLIDFYDVLVGYSSDRWDVPYLAARARKIGFRLDMSKTNWLDCMILYRRLPTGLYVSLKLEDVARRELGEGKTFLIYERGGSEYLWKIFNENREALREYNVQDCRLLKKLSDKLGLVEMAVKTAVFSKVLYSDVMYISRVIDSFLLQKALGPPRVVLPTKVRVEEKVPVKGALTLLNARGLFYNVLDFDFTSMYPRIIQSFNMGFETISEDGEIRSEGSRFRKTPRSLFARFLAEIDEARQRVKEDMKLFSIEDEQWKRLNIYQLMLKTVLNASYGVFMFQSFRLFNPSVANSVTATGRSLLVLLNNLLEKKNLKVVTSDTDGTFAAAPSDEEFRFIVNNVDSFVEDLNAELREEIIKKYNVPEEYYNVYVKLENVFSKLYVTAKKKYVGLVSLPEEIQRQVYGKYISASKFLFGRKKVVGMELKKHDTPEIVSMVQDRVFDIIFDSESEDEMIARVKELLTDVRDMLFSDVFDRELIFKKIASKDLDEYRSNIPHVKAARVLREKNMFRRGDLISFVVTDVGDGGLVAAPVISELDVPRISLNAKKYYFNLILSNVERVLDRKIYLGETLERWLK